MKKVLVYLVGKPGAGKGTISQNLVQMMNADHVIASQLLYKMLLQEYGQDSPEFKQVISGRTIEYFPALDTLIINSIINSKKQLIIIDGYPRIDNQRAAHLMLISANPELQQYTKLILKLEISTEDAFHRISYRRICNKCAIVYSAILDQTTCSQCNSILTARPDDNLEIFQNRIRSYDNTLTTIVKFAEHVDKVITIDVSKKLEIVLQEIIEALKQYIT